jgi:hypothetical protein
MTRSATYRAAARVTLYCALLLTPALAGAQGVPPAGLTELARIRPDPARSAAVRGLVLRRDAGVLELDEGRLWLLPPINGRTVGAVFVGQGNFRFTPPSAIERQRVRAYLGADSVNGAISGAAIFFADGTLAELERSLQFERAEVPGDAVDLVEKMLDYKQWDQYKTWDADFVLPIINAEEDGYFSALVDRRQGEDLLFTIAPREPEGVSLEVHERGDLSDRDPERVAEFAPGGRPPLPVRREAYPTGYRLDVALPQSADGGVNFSATARVEMTADTTVSPWIPLRLYPELEIDEASWDGGMPAPFWKGEDQFNVWIRLPAPLKAGETRTLTLKYHGDLIDRYGDDFYIKSSVGWYPNAFDYHHHAPFDITYRSPYGYRLASVGERTDSTLEGRTVVTRWRHPRPMRNAAFNLGLFDAFDAQVAGSPAITVLYSEKSHRALAAITGELAMKNVRGVITQEVANAMKFFTHVYGPPPEPHFYATETPTGGGEAWPGIVGLSYTTFHQTSNDGEDEVLRSHEVAHQWWAHGVDYRTERDRWLSEGFAQFSALWYLQTSRSDVKPYLALLRHYRDDYLTVTDRTLPPIGIGLRGNTGKDVNDGSRVVYYKSAWVLHMLRVLMLQMSTMSEERFTAGMREFYTTWQGRTATTQDFRAVMEKHANADLGWFFEQWVDGTGMPSYRWAWKAEEAGDGRKRVRVRVRQEGVPEAFQMYVPVTVELRDGRLMRTRVRVAGPVTEAELPLVPGEVKAIRFNDLEGVLASVREERY